MWILGRKNVGDSVLGIVVRADGSHNVYNPRFALRQAFIGWLLLEQLPGSLSEEH